MCVEKIYVLCVWVIVSIWGWSVIEYLPRDCLPVNFVNVAVLCMRGRVVCECVCMFHCKPPDGI